jgi:competence protein ComEA
MKRVSILLLLFVLLMVPMLGVAGSVNINTADARALAAAMQGVGPQKAEAIVAYRDANGPFRSVEQLLQVQGIGAATLEANRGRITLETAE